MLNFSYKYSLKKGDAINKASWRYFLKISKQPRNDCFEISADEGTRTPTPLGTRS